MDINKQELKKQKRKENRQKRQMKKEQRRQKVRNEVMKDEDLSKHPDFPKKPESMPENEYMSFFSRYCSAKQKNLDRKMMIIVEHLKRRMSSRMFEEHPEFPDKPDKMSQEKYVELFGAFVQIKKSKAKSTRHLKQELVH